MPLKPLEVTTSKIATNAVTTSKLADNAVTIEKIKDGAVKTAKLYNKSVTADKLSDASVTSIKIADNAVTTAKIADGAVTREKISDGVSGRPFVPPIASAEIADNAVIESKIQNNAITKDKIKDGAINAAKILPNSITKDRLASNSVGYLEIIDGSVTTPKIVNGAVTPEKLSFVPGGAVRPIDPPVTEGEIADGAIINAKLQYDKLPLIREKIWGVSLPASGASSISNEGILGGLSNMGGVANANDSDGRAKSFTTSVAINSNAGIGPSNYLTTQRGYNPVLTCKFKLGNTTNVRFMCGLFSALAIGSDDPSNLSCIMLRASTSALNTNFVAYVSDGMSSVYADFPIPVPIDTNLHIFEIAISNDGAVIKVTLDGQSFIISGSVPALEQDLGFECIIRTLESAVKSFKYYGAQLIQR